MSRMMDETQVEGAAAVTAVAKPPRRRRRRSSTAIAAEWGPGRWVTYLVLVVGAIVFLAPFAWLISASFQGLGEIFSQSPHWVPHHATGAGYRQFLNLGHLTRSQRGQGTGDWRWFANSAFVALSVTVLQTFFNAMCAYVFAKR